MLEFPHLDKTKALKAPLSIEDLLAIYFKDIGSYELLLAQNKMLQEHGRLACGWPSAKQLMDQGDRGSENADAQDRREAEKDDQRRPS